VQGSIEPFDLILHAGEVVGIAGLLGSGRTELAELLFGIEKPDSGSINMDGKTIRNFSPDRLYRSRRSALPGGPESRGDRTRLNGEGEYHPGYAGQLGLVEAPELGRNNMRLRHKYIKLLNISTHQPINR